MTTTTTRLETDWIPTTWHWSTGWHTGWDHKSGEWKIDALDPGATYPPLEALLSVDLYHNDHGRPLRVMESVLLDTALDYVASQKDEA